MDKNQLLEILDKHINQEALIKDLAIHVVFPFLEEKAKQTNTPLDDMFLAGLKELALK